MSTQKRDRDSGRNSAEPGEKKETKVAGDSFFLCCRKGALSDVEAALANGVSINAVDEFGNTGLSFACWRDDWEVSLPVVQLLLARCCATSQLDNLGRNCLHVAAERSPAAIVSLLLLEMQSLVNAQTFAQKSALALCCRRCDEEAAEVARVLLVAGADLESVEGDSLCTPLLAACRSGRAEVVSLLLARGANVKAVDKQAGNALHLACNNLAFGREMIPLLVGAGVEVLGKDNDGDDAMGSALCRGGEMAETLSKFLPADYKLESHYISSSDPIGAMVVESKYGIRAASNDFAYLVAHHVAWEECWAVLRNGVRLLFDEKVNDVFSALGRCNVVNVWVWASFEPEMWKHPKSGDTLLHLLCRTDALCTDDKMIVFNSLKKEFRNPLTPNFRNERAIDLTNDPILKADINMYMQFRPERKVMRWFGPLFQQRVFAFLLVLKRLKVKVYKDVRLLLIKYMSKVEYIYVPSILKE
jgi:hypothetical protein